MPKTKIPVVPHTAVEAHLTMMQGVINRMATNSASCKAWCVSLVSALLVVIMDKAKPELLPVAYIPEILFLSLDGYYLVQEKRFRNSYNNFIDKLHNSTIVANDLYAISPSGSWYEALWHAAKSFSIWPFYAAMIVFIRFAEGLGK
jgi:hypothetical protein